jgi:hypothetical protein
VAYARNDRLTPLSEPDAIPAAGENESQYSFAIGWRMLGGERALRSKGATEAVARRQVYA